MKTALKHIQQFKKHNPDFNWQHFSAWSKEAFNAQIGKELHEKTKKHTEEGTKHLQAYQRLFRLAQDHSKSEVLFGAGYHSAIQIANMAEREFVNSTAPLFTSNGISAETQAKIIHQEAVSRKSRAVLTYANIVQHNEAHYKAARFANLSDKGSGLDQLPGYAELFGNIDFCSCKSCRSILSPAAYFVDLMRLQAGQIKIDPSDQYSLAKRRPDLQDLVLSCENTNTEVSKLELVNTVLEQNLKNGFTIQEQLVDMPLSNDFSNTGTHKDEVTLKKPKNPVFQDNSLKLTNGETFEVDFAAIKSEQGFTFSVEYYIEAYEVIPSTTIIEVQLVGGESIKLNANYTQATKLRKRVFDYNGQLIITDAKNKSFSSDQGNPGTSFKINVKSGTPFISINNQAIDTYKTEKGESISYDKIVLSSKVKSVKMYSPPGCTYNYSKLLGTIDVPTAFPWNLPFSLPLEQIRTTLEAQHINLASVWQHLSHNDHHGMNLEILGISKEQWKIYSNSQTATEKVLALYGLNPNSTTQAALNNIPTFLKQTGLSRDELEDLLQQDLSEEELKEELQNKFFINAQNESFPASGPVSISNASPEISGLNNLRLDHIERFVRLAHKLKWTFAELQAALEACAFAQNGNTNTLTINDNILPILALIAQVKDRTNCTVYEAAGYVAPLKNIGKANGPTAFALVFENNQIPTPPNWAEQPIWKVPMPSNKSDQTDSDLRIQAALTAALKISESELLLLANAILGKASDSTVTSRPLQLTSSVLAQLYRGSKIATLTGIPIAFFTNPNLISEVDTSFKHALEVYGNDVVSGLQGLMDFGDWIKKVNIAPETVQYIITGKAQSPGLQNQLFGVDTLANFRSSLLTTLANTKLDEQHFIDGLQHLSSGKLERLATENLYSWLCGDYIDKDSGLVTAIPSATDSKLIKEIKVAFPNTSTDEQTKITEHCVSMLTQYRENQTQTFHKLTAGLLGITHPIVDAILQYDQLNLITVLKDDATATDKIRKLQRIASLVNLLQLSAAEITCIYGHPQYFDVTQTTPNPEHLFSLNQFQNYALFKSLVYHFQDGQNHLISYLNYVQANPNAFKEDKQLADTSEKLAAITQWDSNQIAFLIEKLWKNSNSGTQPIWGTVKGIYQLKMYFDLSTMLGTDIKTLVQLNHLSNINLTSTANALFAGLQQGNSASKATQLQNTWGEAKRNALVPLVISDLNDVNIATPNDLYKYLLIDVEVQGDVKTSPVKEAISAVQLYIYRVLNNLEPTIKLVEDELTNWWPWMESYRTWKANREIFLYPENYIEPQLRKSKSPLFTELENNLQQIDITVPDNINRVFKTYLDGLMAVTDLRILNSYAREYQEFNSGAQQTVVREVCFVGTSSRKPNEYFYQLAKFVAQGDIESPLSKFEAIEWGSWLPIQGIHMPSGKISPVYAFGKWYMFWVENRQSGAATNGNEASFDNYTASINYTYLDFNSNWVAPATLGTCKSAKDPQSVQPEFIASIDTLVVPFTSGNDPKQQDVFTIEGSSVKNQPLSIIPFVSADAPANTEELTKSDVQYLHHIKPGIPYSSIKPIKGFMTWFKVDESSNNMLIKLTGTDNTTISFEISNLSLQISENGKKGKTIDNAIIKRSEWNSISTETSLYPSNTHLRLDLSSTMIDISTASFYRGRQSGKIYYNGRSSDGDFYFYELDGLSLRLLSRNGTYGKIKTVGVVSWCYNENSYLLSYRATKPAANQLYLAHPYFLFDTNPVGLVDASSKRPLISNTDPVLTDAYRNTCTLLWVDTNNNLQLITGIDPTSLDLKSDYTSIQLVDSNQNTDVSSNQRPGIVWLEQDETFAIAWVDSGKYLMYASVSKDGVVSKVGKVKDGYNSPIQVEQSVSLKVVKNQVYAFWIDQSQKASYGKIDTDSSDVHIIKTIETVKAQHSTHILPVDYTKNELVFSYFDEESNSAWLNMEISHEISLNDEVFYTTWDASHDYNKYQIGDSGSNILFRETVFFEDLHQGKYPVSGAKDNISLDFTLGSSSDKIFAANTKVLPIANQPNWRIEVYENSFFLAYPYEENGKVYYQTFRLNSSATNRLAEILTHKQIPGLLTLEAQQTTETPIEILQPEFTFLKPSELPSDTIDFLHGPLAPYYWELFFHAPFLVASKLQTELQFREAKTWYEYIFNPLAPGKQDRELQIAQDSTENSKTYTLFKIADTSSVSFDDGEPLHLGDDKWSDVITLPFFFEFYGELYNQLLVSSNGMITFDISLHGSNPAATPGEKKCPSTELPKNTIFCCFTDLDPTDDGGTITYGISGNAPHRSFSVNYNKVKRFGSSIEADTVTAKLVLHETTNEIEIYLGQIPNFSSKNNLVGIQNSTGEEGIVPDGRNTGAWSVRKIEGWSFLHCSSLSNNTEEKDAFWNFEGLRSDYNTQLSKELSQTWAQNFETSVNAKTSNGAAQLYQYHNDPYDPQAIAALRPIAYQKTMVMHYIDNLIDWGDQLFRQFTIEDINEAEMLYIMAQDLLGDKPRNLESPKLPQATTLKNILSKADIQLDQVHEFLIKLETAQTDNSHIKLGNTPSNFIPNLYFGLPPNQQFTRYWDKVNERLTNIRNGLNIDGKEVALPLFEPALNPKALAAQIASGAKLESVLSPVIAGIPYYRFEVILQKAKEVTQSVIQLGNGLLNALEKKDATGLALLNHQNQQHILTMTTASRQDAIDQLEQTIKALEVGKEHAQERVTYYQDLIEAGWINSEEVQIGLSAVGIEFQTFATIARPFVGAASVVPNIGGLAIGGMDWGRGAEQIPATFDSIANTLHSGSGLSGTIASFRRRAAEWSYQKKLAKFDMEQAVPQIQSAMYQKAMAEKELQLLEENIEQEQKVEAYLKNQFSNEQLYDWTIGKISSLYFQAYQLASNFAKQAQYAWQFENGIDIGEVASSSTFIQTGIWDTLHQGLHAGDTLMLDLQRMESSFMKQDERRLEIKKTIALSELGDNPPYINDLNDKGECTFDITEKTLHDDFPSHYCRQIKYVTLTIPSVVGPYQNIHASLTQTANKTVIKNNDAAATTIAKLINPDLQGELKELKSDIRAQQQIAISSGQSDTGLFQLNMNDPRYLPFEGTGANSSWILEIPANKVSKSKDNDSSPKRINISEVIMEIHYTAVDGGAAFEKLISDKLGNK